MEIVWNVVSAVKTDVVYHFVNRMTNHLVFESNDFKNCQRLECVSHVRTRRMALSS